MSIPPIPSSWQPVLAEEIKKPYFQKLKIFLTEARQKKYLFLRLIQPWIDLASQRLIGEFQIFNLAIAL